MAGYDSLTAHTRFAVPRIPNAKVRRPALLTRLDTGTDCALTMVTAAPGSGKSALLAEWATALRRDVAWLSCDIDDADPGWFWRDVRTAIQHSWPSAAVNVADDVEQRDPRQLAIEIANELVDLDRGVIVIDDFHLAAPGPAAMIAFIDALPPTVRLVLGSRHDPPFSLSRMRVQGRLLELRQNDLRFTSDETRELLADLGVELSPDDLDRVVSVTEGWPVGVHLAGLSLRTVADPERVLTRLVDTDRSLIDFLMSEVIELQSADMQEFLAVTGQLETFDAGLCDAVTDRTDSAEVLERVSAANLFLVGLDGEGRWYRYHHLFNEFLRARMNATAPERVSVIHRLAAATFAERGDLLNAVRHCLRAGDLDAAFEHLADHMAKTTTLTDRALGGFVARAWLDEHGVARLESDPSMVLECAIALDAVRSPDAAEHWLTRVEHNRPRLDPTSEFLLDGAWSFHLLCQGDPAAAVVSAKKAYSTVETHAIRNKWAPALSSMLVLAQIWADDLDGAMATVDAMRDASDGNVIVASVKVPGLSSVIAVRTGDLLASEQLARQSEAAADHLELSAFAVARAEPVLTLTEIAIENNQLDRAQVEVDRLMRILDHEYRPLIAMTGHLIRARLASAAGEHTEVASHLEQARSAVPNPTSLVVAHIDRVELRHALDCGSGNVETLLRRLPRSPTFDLLAARVRLASGDDEEARAILSRAPADATRRYRIEHGMLSALALASSDISLAHARLQDALAMAEAGGFQQSIVNEGPRLWTLLRSLPTSGRLAAYTARLLRAAGGVVPPARRSSQDLLIEPLSDRELTVLRYLSSKLDATEIADSLYISVNTVRSHIKAIYRKLGVNSRVDAVRHGEALGLL
jgi:LuxR family maltose regulon positive regulatory protein